MGENGDSWGSVAGLCEHINGSSCYLKAGTFLTGSITVKIPRNDLYREVRYLAITDDLRVIIMFQLQLNMGSL